MPYNICDSHLTKTSNDRQRYFMDRAAKNALKSDVTHKHGAILVQDNRIISEGYNRVYNCHDHIYSIHAEVDVIGRAKKMLKTTLFNAELYVVRIGKASMDNCLKYSKPCKNCANYIIRNGIRRVYYSTNYEFDLMADHIEKTKTKIKTKK